MATAICLAGCLWWGPSTQASPPDKKAEALPIRITADKLVTDNSVRTAEFSGNVKAVQGDTEVLAQRLKLFYGDSAGGASAASGDIERIEAYGEVKITFDNKVAVSDQAIYITDTRKLILQGPGSKVTSGKDEIVGSKITFFRNDGRVILDGDTDNRVKAIIHSSQRGLN